MDKFELSEGQTVILDLEEECVLGEVLHIGAKRSFIRLTNVRDLATNQPIVGNQDFYYSEIKSVKVIDEGFNNDEDEDFEDALEDCSTTASLVSPRGNRNRTRRSRIDLEQVEAAFERIKAHVFIHQTDMKYHEAIKYLQTQKLISISMEGVEKGRHAVSPSLLSIATLERIYIFDVMWMKVPEGIKALLASTKVRRVVHNARLMSDALEHRLGTPLGKCFDTLVAHISTSVDDDYLIELTIEECLAKYLNLPKNFFDASITFDTRPLNEKQRIAAAKRVAFLLPLQDYLIHEVMLKPFYRSCMEYDVSLSGDKDNMNSVMKLSRGRNMDINEIERFKLNIRETEEGKETGGILNNSLPSIDGIIEGNLDREPTGEEAIEEAKHNNHCSDENSEQK